MLKIIFLLFLLTFKSRSNLLFDEIEPVHHEVLLAYFSNPVLQVHYIYLEMFLNLRFHIAPSYYPSTNQGIFGVSRNLILWRDLGGEERQ